MKKILLPLLLLVIALPAFYALLKPGINESHDGTLHTIWIWQMSQALASGQFPGRWGNAVYGGLGLPLFVANFQLPYYLGALLFLAGFSLTASLKIQLILAVILSAFFIYLLLQKLFDPYASLVGTFLYTWAPYRFADTFTRAAIGEVWIFVFLPLFVYLLIANSRGLSRFVYASLVWGLMVISHTAVVIFLFPFLFLFSLFLDFQHKSAKIFKFFLAATFFGFALSAFCLLPAIFEQKFLQVDQVFNSYYKSQFISIFQLLHIPKPKVDLVSIFQFGVANTSILFSLFIFAGLKSLFSKRKQRKIPSLGIFMLWSVLLSLFLITPQSKFIWDNLPLLQKIMFPWRFLIVSVFAISIAAANLIHLFSSPTRKLLLAGVFIFFIILSNYSYLNPGHFEARNDAYYKTRASHPSPLEKAFLPKTADPSLIEYADPEVEVIGGSAQIANLDSRSGRISFSLNSENDASLVKIGQLYFPGWQIRIDNKKVDIGEFQDPYRGLITFIVGKGSHQVEVRFAETSVRLFADLVSLTGLMVLTGLFIYSVSRRFIR